jgi:predicted XRE-type DNA-binding protein
MNSTPDNLYWGTAKENQQDRLRHPTTGAGEAHPLARITAANVIEIRELLAKQVKQREIADRFGISQPQVSNIGTGRRWVHA